MKSLADILSQPRRSPPRARRTWRRGSVFIADTKPYHCKIDRNAKARLLHYLEVCERWTKLRGKRSGVLGLATLHLARILLHHCIGASGLCCPSYAHLQRLTGLSRSAIASGMARLERLGVLVRTRRLKREWVLRASPITGEQEKVLLTVQHSTLLTIRTPANIGMSSFWELPAILKPSTPSGRVITSGLAMKLFGGTLRGKIEVF